LALDEAGVRVVDARLDVGVKRVGFGAPLVEGFVKVRKRRDAIV
jgi:hypothetical protein